MPSTPDATMTSPARRRRGSTRAPCASGGSPSTPTTMPPARVRSLTAPTAAFRSMMQLHPGGVRRHRADDPADDALRGDHGHVRLRRRRPAAVDGHRQQSRVGVAGDDLGRQRRQRVVLSRRLEQRLEPFGARRERPLLLQPDLEVGHLLAQRSRSRPARRAGRSSCSRCPPTPREDAGGAALEAGEHAERDALEHRHAGLRLHLRGNQDQVADHHARRREPRCAGGTACGVRSSFVRVRSGCTVCSDWFQLQLSVQLALINRDLSAAD